MTLFTIGFTKKTAECFFELLGRNEMEILVDIRLNNKSQLAGFAKSEDLKYFLKKICNCSYVHCPEYAPTSDILEKYKSKNITWSDYELKYNKLMRERNAACMFRDRFVQYERICLLCSEETPQKCHRRLLAELIADTGKNILIKHL